MAETAFTLDDQRLDDAFARRHISPDEKQAAAMLKAVGASSLDDLSQKVTPLSIRNQGSLDLPDAMTERQVLDYLKGMADKNEIKTSMIGMGYYGTITPTVILRNVLENPGWYTAYTPYLYRLQIIEAWARDHRGFWLRLFEVIQRSWLTIIENGLATLKSVFLSGLSPTCREFSSCCCHHYAAT